MNKALAIYPLGYQAYQKDIPCIQKRQKIILSMTTESWQPIP
jgi:hypothetical protein